MLVVTNDEEPREQQPGDKAAGHLGADMKIPARAGHGDEQEKGGRPDCPPALERIVLRESLGGQGQVQSIFRLGRAGG